MPAQKLLRTTETKNCDPVSPRKKRGKTPKSSHVRWMHIISSHLDSKWPNSDPNSAFSKLKRASRKTLGTTKTRKWDHTTTMRKKQDTKDTPRLITNNTTERVSSTAWSLYVLQESLIAYPEAHGSLRVLHRRCLTERRRYVPVAQHRGDDRKREEWLGTFGLLGRPPGVGLGFRFLDAVTSHEQRLNPSAGEMEYMLPCLCAVAVNAESETK